MPSRKRNRGNATPRSAPSTPQRALPHSAAPIPPPSPPPSPPARPPAPSQRPSTFYERLSEKAIIDPSWIVPSGMVWDTGWFFVTYVLDVLKHAAVFAKKPIALLLLLYLAYVGLIKTSGFLITSVLSPICALPLMPSLIPICKYIPPLETPEPDFPNLVNLQSKFEAILEESASGTTLALELKNSEAAIRDLTILVKHSDLVSKEKLASQLDTFVAAAKSAGRELQRLGSRVGGAVDNILAMDDYVLRLLEEANSVPQLGSAAAFLNALIPFRSSTAQQGVAKRKMIEDVWYQATGVMETNVARLIREAEANVVLLDRLEGDLDVISQMISTEAIYVRTKTDELLAELWTRLGGNRKQLANFKSHRALLANIRQYRNHALRYVTSTLVQLQQLSSDLEDLRERVATPMLTGPEANIPLEVHIGSIRRGIDRLTLGREKAQEREDAYIRKLLDGETLPTIGEA